MNILFCGDRNIEDGILIATASLLRHVSEPLSITILTMKIETPEKQFFPVSSITADYLDHYVAEKLPSSHVRLYDMTQAYEKEKPTLNLDTRFTPYCMLRLFSDKIESLTGRVLYLDTDVICRKDPTSFVHMDMEGADVAGVLDYYGQWFFHSHGFHFDYLNSGVLLLDMDKIREEGLFVACRERCRTKKMFMPDQSAINKLAHKKKITDRRYNEQAKVKKDTVFQHFTTRFVAFPWIHTLTVKPWQIDAMHRKMKLFEYDDLLDEYLKMKEEVENGGKIKADTN